jgi:hypothetical protein
VTADAAAPPGPRPPLAALTALFDALDAAGIRYCHWKSNEHLDASLRGETDLDVLFDRRQTLHLTHLLAQLGGKRFVVKPGRGYPGIEDYVVFDPPTGALSHLHVHYQLTVGEKFLKGYRLPWEESVLGTRTRDLESGVWVADPHVELVVLVTRAALKLRTRDRVLRLAGRTSVRGDLLRELRWLIARTDPARLADFARPLVGARASAELLALIAESPPTLRRLRAFRGAASPDLASYRMYAAPEARRRRWVGELETAWSVLAAVAREGHRISSRTPPQGGLAVACVGADAPALAHSLAAWLAHEARTTYFPAADGVADARFARERARGGIVITDEWDAAALVPPDLVIRRSATATPLPVVPPATRVVDLDPRLALPDAVLLAKRAVWEAV